MMSKKIIILSLLFIIPVLLFVVFFLKDNASRKEHRHSKAAVSAATENTTRHEKYGGTLVLGTPNPPEIINPILSHHSVSVTLLNLIFDTLIRFDQNGNAIPGLARKWDISADGLEYTFYLREDVSFHDGAPLTAEDVKFTYDLHRSEYVASFRKIGFDVIQDIVVQDKWTLKIILKEKNVFFLRRLLAAIVPKHVYGGQNLAEADFNSKPVGSGMYQFQSWDKTTHQIELVVNENYYDGRANIQRIIVKTYPSIPQMWSALLRGEVDFVSYLSRDDYNVLNQDPDFQTFKVVGRLFSAMYFSPENQLLSDPEVREAISMSIDRKQLIADLSHGGAACYTPLPVDRSEARKAYRYDALKAKLKLMHRGWIDTDGDGILEKDFQDLEIRLLVRQSGDIFAKLALLLRQQLSEVGIKVTILLYETEKDLNEDFLRKHRANAWLRFFMGEKEDENVLYSALGTWTAFSNLSGQIWKYNNPKIDHIYETVSQADKGERQKLFRQAGQILAEDQPLACLFYMEEYYAISSRIKNVQPYFYSDRFAYLIKDWYIPEPVLSGHNGK